MFKNIYGIFVPDCSDCIHYPEKRGCSLDFVELYYSEKRGCLDCPNYKPAKEMKVIKQVIVNGW